MTNVHRIFKGMAAWCDGMIYFLAFLKTFEFFHVLSVIENDDNQAAANLFLL